jgi:LysR family glycine cleavage system transcriptional activator
MLPVATPAFTQKYDLSKPEALLNLPLIHLESRPTAWDEWFSAAGLDEAGTLHGKQFGQFSMIIAGAVASLGAALLPSYLIESELARGELKVLFDIPLTTENSYYIIRPRGVHKPISQTFEDWILSEIPSI